MKQTRFFFTVGVLCVILGIIAEGCSTKPETSPLVDVPKGSSGNLAGSGVTVFVTSSGSDDPTLRLPGNCDLLTVVQRVRELGGLKVGKRQILNITMHVNGKNVEYIIDLARVTVRKAEEIIVPDGTFILVVDREDDAW